MLGMVLQGVASACSSGSLDALLLEHARRKGGQEGMQRTISRLSALQCGALALGSVVSGLLPNRQEYSIHLLCMALLAAASLALACMGRGEDETKKSPRAGAYFAQWAHSLRGCAELKWIFACMALSAVPVFVVETYWQPVASEQMPQQALGALCAAAYGMTMLGSLCAGRLRISRWVLYGGVLAGLALCLWLMPGAIFAAAYLAFYALLGAADVAEQTIVNAASADETRSGMMSVGALCGKLGGIGSSVLGAALMGGLGIAGLWKIAALISLLAAAFALVRARCALRPPREKAR